MMNQRKKEMLAVSIFFISVSLAFCETQFVKAVGREDQDLAWCIVRTTDGGYALAGWTGHDDALLVKLDSLGNHQWSRTLEKPGTDERAQALIQTADRGYAMAGVTGGDILLAKFDSSGNHEWSKAMDGAAGEQAYSLIQTTDGGYAIAGVSGGDAMLTKFDSSWNHQWTRTLGGVSSDEARCVVQTEDGGYALAGETWSFGAGENDVLLAKFDSLGNHQWSRILGGSDNETARSLIQTTDGGYTISAGSNGFSIGDYDVFLARFDSSGTYQWSRQLGGNGADFPRTIVQTGDGGYVITGWTDSYGAGRFDVFLTRFDLSGSHVWTKTIGGESNDKGYDLVQTADGGYAVGGYTVSFSAGGLDFMLATFDSLGKSCMDQAAIPTVGAATPSVDTTTPSIDSISPTITEPSLTINSPGPTATIVCREGRAVLECSLWAEPCTVLTGENIQLRMSVKNTGGGYADSVGPEATAGGGGNADCVSGPSPSHANVGPATDIIFTWTYTAEDTQWVYWTGYAAGRDHMTDSVVTSAEDTSNQVLIQISEAFIRSDADADMNVRMSDAILILKYLYVPGNPEPICTDAADANDDGEVVMSDAVYTLKYLYVPGSPAPPPPHPGCGPDPTADALRCFRHSCTTPFIRGDCSGDTLVNLVDIFYIVQYVDYGQPVPSCLDAADVDDDGNVDIDDANYLSDYLTSQGPAPPHPFPNCGKDLTADTLGCFWYLPCASGKGSEDRQMRLNR